MITFEHVVRKYGKKTAVDGLDLVVPPGELFAFLGPNGAGKTTTIRMAVGLLRPTAGRVSICGLDVVEHRREATARVGYVPDHPYLYDKLSGREVLQFVAEMRGIVGEAAARRIGRMSELLELDDFLDERTENYSHGMKQRLVLATALIHDPEVLIVDEPMVGLDPRSMRMVKDLLSDRARRGAAVFVSTHTLAVAEEIADRIGVIDRGRTVFVGTLSELKQRGAEQESASLERLYLQLTSPDSDDPVAAGDAD